MENELVRLSFPDFPNQRLTLGERVAACVSVLRKRTAGVALAAYTY